MFNASTPTAAQDNVAGRPIGGYDVLFSAPLAILLARQTTLGVRWSF